MGEVDYAPAFDALRQSLDKGERSEVVGALRALLDVHPDWDRGWARDIRVGGGLGHCALDALIARSLL